MGNGTRYIARLRNASFQEVLYRGRQALAARYWRLSGRMAARVVSAPVPERESVATLSLPELRPVQGNRCSDDAPVIGERPYHEAHDMIRRCEELYQGTILYDSGSVSLPYDIRSVWEPARLQQVTELILRVSRTEDPDSSKTLHDMALTEVLGWLAHNPFPYGLHYLSAMECGLRIPVFFYALKCLKLADEEFARIARAVWCHAWLVRTRLSLYSSLGNHTIAECVGLVFAGAVFRETEVGREWLEQGFSLLRQELTHQIHADGGPAEQSFAYHRFVLDLYWLVTDFAARNGLADCSDLLGRLSSGEDFLASFQDERGTVPAIGDSDDGWAVAPHIAPARRRAPAAAPGVTSFPESGYTVIRTASGGLVTFDHGPLGMAPLYNHGHADALSVTFSLCGNPFLVDPGTYRYNNDPQARVWFKGTRSHNTVTVDGLDQAIQKTGFIWSRPYRSGVVRQSEKDGMFRVEAIHDGYARIAEPVRHKRSILRFDDCGFLIRDTFWGEGIHRYEMNWHLHPDVTYRLDQGWWHLKNGGRTVFLCTSCGGTSAEDTPETVITAGFFSSSYGIRRKSALVRCSREGFPDETVFSTILCTGYPLDEGRKERLLCSASLNV